MSWVNFDGLSDCGPSDSASSGRGCTSMIRPSAPHATAALAMGALAVEGLRTGALAGTLFVAASDSSPPVAKFAEEYKKQFGKEPNFAAQIGYTGAQLVILALKNAGKDLTADSFVAGMESIKDWRDIFGSPPMSFSKTRHQGSNESFLCVVKGGRWAPVSTTAVGY